VDLCLALVLVEVMIQKIRADGGTLVDAEARMQTGLV
jgi:hypothetical protein